MLIAGILICLVGVLIAVAVHRTVGLAVTALGVLLILIVVFNVADSEAYAAGIVPGPGDPTPIPDGPAATALPLYLMALSALVPLAGYVLNHWAPFIRSEPLKGAIQAALAAGVAVLYQAATPGDLGFNDETLLAVLVAMGSALLAHFGYKAGRINVALGGGTNRDGSISDPKVLPTAPPGAPDVND